MSRPAELFAAILVAAALTSCGHEGTPTGPSGPTSFLPAPARADVRGVSDTRGRLVPPARDPRPSGAERQGQRLRVPRLPGDLRAVSRPPSADAGVHAADQRQSGTGHSDALAGMGLRDGVRHVSGARPSAASVPGLLQSPLTTNRAVWDDTDRQVQYHEDRAQDHLRIAVATSGAAVARRAFVQSIRSASTG